MSVDPAHAGRLEELFAGQPLTLIGQVGAGANFKISRHGRTLLRSSSGNPEDRLGAPFRRSGMRKGRFLV